MLCNYKELQLQMREPSVTGKFDTPTNTKTLMAYTKHQTPFLIPKTFKKANFITPTLYFFKKGALQLQPTLYSCLQLALQLGST